MQNLPITVGDCVRVRRERWRVVSARRYEDCRLLALRGIGRGNRNVEKRVLLPFEMVDPVRARRPVRFVASSRWRRECRRALAAVGGADALRSARTASMDLLPHQLAPALAIVRGDTSRILIADDVGLGKTVQAGLVVSELLLRGTAERVLILTPAGLREQWIDELTARFRLRFTLADTAAIQHRRALIRPGMNPWATIPLVVASLDYIKRPEVLPAVEACRWDLVIVDEAHGVVNAGDRHAAVSRLAARAPYVLLLTATPHSGDAGAFASLRALGSHADPLRVFRRTRRDVGMATDRRVHRIVVQPSGAEREMHARLEAFSAAVEADHSDRASDVWLALSIIHKRALSSAFALHQTVIRRLDSLAEDDEPFEQQLLLPLDHDAGERDPEDGIPRWTCPALRDPHTERTLLGAIATAALAALGAQAKLRALERMIRRIGEPVVVFTEYRDTLLHLRDRVAPGAAIVHGGLSRGERRAALDAFSRGDRRVLLATDAAGEGLNLHQTCRVVINLELPWNPMRLEQRIGRVDRIGQRRRVHAIHLIAAGTREPAVFARLQQRLVRARRDIDIPDPLGIVLEQADLEPPVPGIDASVEHRRLVEARRLMGRSSDVAEEAGARTGTLVTTARPRLRARIAPRALALVRTTLGDEAGIAVAHHLEGILLALNGRPARGSHREMQALIDELDAVLVRRQLLVDDWAQRAMAIRLAFWTRRVDRERAILAVLAERLARPHQPGLFRAYEPDSLADASAHRGAAANPARYLEAAERSRSLTPSAIVVTVLLVC